MNGLVRICGGKFRGQKIRTPGAGTHPMGERERLALFNMLAGHIEGRVVADLFCGGGTLGIEALSRGAEFVLMIDDSQPAVTTAKENLRKLGILSKCTKTSDGVGCGMVIRAKVADFVRETTQKFDVVLADPPYDAYDEKMVVGLAGLIGEGGVLVLSHPGEAPSLPKLNLVKTRTYAGARISIYQK